MIFSDSASGAAIIAEKASADGGLFVYFANKKFFILRLLLGTSGNIIIEHVRRRGLVRPFAKTE
jgi:hypothetical protein